MWKWQQYRVIRRYSSTPHPIQRCFQSKFYTHQPQSLNDQIIMSTRNSCANSLYSLVIIRVCQLCNPVQHAYASENDNPLLKSGACVKGGAKRQAETRGQLWNLSHSWGTGGRTKSNTRMHESERLESACKTKGQGLLIYCSFAICTYIKRRVIQ